MNGKNWIWALIMTALVLVSGISSALLVAQKPDTGTQCNWMYDKAVEASKTAGRGMYGEVRAANNSEVSAWANLYMACLERHK